MPKPLVSICIPVYNVEPYLRQCLDSVLNQTFTDFEVIIVNDASPDNSEVVVKEYVKKDQRVKYLKHEKNRGLPFARETALQHARGNYISFIDSDDWVDPTFLEKLYQQVITTQADVVICNTLLYYHQDHSEIALDLRQSFLPPFFIHQSATGIGPGYCNKLWKKELFEKPEVELINIFWGEDLLVCSKLLYYCNKIAIIDEPLYFYRVDYFKHNTSKSKIKREEKLIKNLSDEYIIHKNLLNFFNQRGYLFAIQELLAQRTDQFWFYGSEVIALRSKRGKQLLLKLIKKYHGPNSYKPISMAGLWLKSLLLFTLNTTLPSKLFIKLKRIYVKLYKNTKPNKTNNGKLVIQSELSPNLDSEKPIISVCIPIYNSQLFITKCLDSVINQTLKNIEIIAVDDCSTDNSLAILTQYEERDSRFKIIRHTYNQGANAARETALQHARGNYISFIDSDDWIDSTMLEKLYRHSNHGERDVVICKLALVYGKNLSVPYVNIKPHTIKAFNQNSSHIFPEGVNPGFTNKIWKTKLFRQYEIKFLNISFGEDLAVTCKLFFYAQKIAFVDETLYFYRLEHQPDLAGNYQTSMNRDKEEQKLIKRLEEEFALYEDLLAFFTPLNLSTEITTILGKRNYWFFEYIQLSIILKSKPALDLLEKLFENYHGTISAYPINFSFLKWKSLAFGQLKRFMPSKIYYLLLSAYIKYLK